MFTRENWSAAATPARAYARTLTVSVGTSLARKKKAEAAALEQKLAEQEVACKRKHTRGQWGCYESVCALRCGCARAELQLLTKKSRNMRGKDMKSIALGGARLVSVEANMAN